MQGPIILRAVAKIMGRQRRHGAYKSELLTDTKGQTARTKTDKSRCDAEAPVFTKRRQTAALLNAASRWKRNLWSTHSCFKPP